MEEKQGHSLCKCGCGQEAAIRKYPRYKNGRLIHKAGESIDFLKGHHQSVGRRGVLPPGALIDPEDQPIADKHVWCLSHGYVSTKTSRLSGEKRQTIFLHRLIMNAPVDMEVDHINRNPMDNRKCNLRVVPHGINQQNLGVRSQSGTGIRNVQKNKWGKYQVLICINGKRHYVGYYKCIEEAERAATAFRLKNMPGAVS